MGIINYAAERRLLTVARGHPYERDAFAGLFEGLDEFDVCHVEQPAAQRLMGPELARDVSALVCYDMPGVDFTGGGPEAGLVEPEAGFRENYLAMLEAGVGIVFLHHALAAWPACRSTRRLSAGASTTGRRNCAASSGRIPGIVTELPIPSQRSVPIPCWMVCPSVSR